MPVKTQFVVRVLSGELCAAAARVRMPPGLAQQE